MSFFSLPVWSFYHNIDWYSIRYFQFQVCVVPWKFSLYVWCYLCSLERFCHDSKIIANLHVFLFHLTRWKLPFMVHFSIPVLVQGIKSWPVQVYVQVAEHWQQWPVNLLIRAFTDSGENLPDMMSDLVIGWSLLHDAKALPWLWTVYGKSFTHCKGEKNAYIEQFQNFKTWSCCINTRGIEGNLSRRGQACRRPRYHKLAFSVQEHVGPK